MYYVKKQRVPSAEIYGRKPCLVAKIRQQAAFYNVGQSCSGKKNKSVGSKGEVVCGMEIRRSYADRIKPSDIVGNVKAYPAENQKKCGKSP